MQTSQIKLKKITIKFSVLPKVIQNMLRGIPLSRPPTNTAIAIIVGGRL